MSEKKGKGKIIIVSGFSGTGKGTMISKLMERHPGKYAFSVSATTRKPRPGEEDGKDYFFVDHDRFEEMIAGDELLEHTSFSGNYYGTPAGPINKLLAEGQNIILDIEVTGMHQVTYRRSDTLTAFIVPPSEEELIRRLTGRGTESREQIVRRLTRATEEAAFAHEYACIIKNGDLEQSVDELEAYIETEKQDPRLHAENLRLTEDISNKLKRYISKEI